MQNLSCDNEFYLYENKKNHFHINGFACSLALKKRLEETGKWPIVKSSKPLTKNLLWQMFPGAICCPYIGWPPRRRPLGFVRHAFISPPRRERDERTPKDVCGEAIHWQVCKCENREYSCFPLIIS